MNKSEQILAAFFLGAKRNRLENSPPINCAGCEVPEKNLEQIVNELTDFLNCKTNSSEFINSIIEELEIFKFKKPREFMYIFHPINLLLAYSNKDLSNPEIYNQAISCTPHFYDLIEKTGENQFLGEDIETKKEKELIAFPVQKIKKGYIVSAHWNQIIEPVLIEDKKYIDVYNIYVLLLERLKK